MVLPLMLAAGLANGLRRGFGSAVKEGLKAADNKSFAGRVNAKLGTNFTPKPFDKGAVRNEAATGIATGIAGAGGAALAGRAALAGLVKTGGATITRAGLINTGGAGLSTLTGGAALGGIAAARVAGHMARGVIQGHKQGLRGTDLAKHAFGHTGRAVVKDARSVVNAAHGGVVATRNAAGAARRSKVGQKIETGGKQFTQMVKSKTGKMFERHMTSAKRHQGHGRLALPAPSSSNRQA